MTARLPSIAWGPTAVLTLACLAVGVLAGVEPWMGVVAALGLVLLLVTFVDLAAGVVVLVVVVFAETTPVAGPALSFTKVVGFVLAFGWFARLATRPATSDRLIFNAHPAFSFLIVAFLAWVALSATWAEDAGEALTEGSRLLLVALLYMIVYTAVQTRQQAFWVLGGLAVGAAGTSAYGLVVRPENEGANTERLVSTVQDPNVLAAVLVTGLALAIAGFFASRGLPAIRLAAGVAAALCLLGFLLTGSRGGLVALSVALVAAVVFGGRWRGRALVMGLLVVSFGLAYYSLYASDDLRDRVASAIQGETNGGELEQQESRLTIWAVGWRMAEDNPLTGVGVGNFKEVSPEYVLEPGTLFRTDRVIDEPAEAHNTYLHVLAELGVVGAALFLAITVFSFASAVRAGRRFAQRGDWRMEMLTRGLIVALAGVLAAGFFISSVESKTLWLLLALGPTLLAIAAHAERPDGREASVRFGA